MSRQSRNVIESDLSKLTRRKWLSASGGLLAGLAGIGEVSAANKQITPKDLGIAAPHTQVLGMDGSGDKAYVATYGTKPTYVGEFDINAFKFTKNYELPSGMGAWTLAPRNEHIYVGTYDYSSEASLIDINTSTGEVSELATFPGDTFIWDVEVAENGMLYMGSYPKCRVYEVNPETGEVQSFGPMAEGEKYVRSIAVDENYVYAGIGSHAHLAKLDRETGEWTQILPDGLSDRSWVYGIDSVGGKLVANVEPGGIVLMDKSDPQNNWQWIKPDTGVTVRGIFEEYQGDIYAPTYSTSTSWQYYKYDVSEGTWTNLGSIPGYSFPDQYIHGDIVIGSGQNTIWKQNLATGERREAQVTDVGMKASAAIAQSLATLNGVPVVANSGALNFHTDAGSPSSGSGGKPTQVEASGEPKAMVSVGNELYMAVYPGARLYRYTESEGVKLLHDVQQSQNRPRAIDYQEATDRILMGTRPVYGDLGGAIVAYHRQSGEVSVDRNVVQDQSIRSVTSTDQAAYLGSEIYGGEGSTPTASEARLVSWDPVNRSVNWQITPVSGATQITDLQAANGYIFGVAETSSAAKLFVVYPKAQRSVYTTQLPAAGEFALAEDRNLYGALGDGITKIETDSFEVTHYVDGFSHLNEIKSDSQGHFYVVGQEDYHLYQFTTADFSDGRPL